MNLFNFIRLTKKIDQFRAISKSRSKSDLKNRLIKQATGSFIVKLAYVILAFITIVVLARLLGTQDFGTYAYAITWVELLSIPATFGLDKLFVREVAVYKAKSEWGLIRGLLRWANLTVLLISLILCFLIIITIWLINENFSSPLSLALSLALISLPITSLRNIRLATMRGLDKVVLGLLPESIIAPLLLILLSGFSYLIYQEEFGYIQAILAYIISATVTFLIGERWLRKSLPSEISKSTHTYKIKNWFLRAFPFMLISGMQIFYAKTDIVMLGWLTGTKEVAIYVVVSRLAQTITFVMIAVNYTLGSTIANLYFKRNNVQIQKIITKSTYFTFFFAVVIGGFYIIFGNSFLIIFGSDFIEGKIALVLLSIGQIINAGTGSAGLILTMANKEKIIGFSLGVSALSNYILNFLLIPIWGMNGAALSTLISLISLNIFHALILYKNLDINSTVLAKLK